VRTAVARACRKRSKSPGRRRPPARREKVSRMKYVTRVLQPGEVVVHETHLHPLIFLPALLWLAIAVGFLIAAVMVSSEELPIRLACLMGAALCAFFAFLYGVRAWIRRATTELAITDRRVIYKSGLISRHTLEMNRSKVESVDVDQSLLGRMFGFGTIVLRGTGGSLEPMRMISDPLVFRSHITAA
jgi:membrane protein YdbS with pleckstrin-like domain